MCTFSLFTFKHNFAVMLLGNILYNCKTQACTTCFFGTAFTIMAYHNDIGIVMLFREVYHIFMGYYPEGPNVLETSYSIGLGLGIVLFYNHIGKRKLTKDPTPIEVAMYQYEQDVDYALIDLADRLGTEKEADV